MTAPSAGSRAGPVPADAGGGKIKVRIFVSKRIDLVFNTTYAFPKK